MLQYCTSSFVPYVTVLLLLHVHVAHVCTSLLRYAVPEATSKVFVFKYIINNVFHLLEKQRQNPLRLLVHELALGYYYLHNGNI